jgi:AraC-like DNA-binding protein
MREEHKEAVQRMLEFIDEHLSIPITLHQLAQVAQYSPWHSARMFKEATGMAPFTYLRHRRLSEAARRLEKPEQKVVDVAFDSQTEREERNQLMLFFPSECRVSKVRYLSLCV